MFVEKSISTGNGLEPKNGVNCYVISETEAPLIALLTAVDSRTNPASTAGTAQHDLDLVSG